MSTEILSAIEQIGRNFEEFKKLNDSRIAEIEKKGHADPLLEAKLDKIGEKLNRLEESKEKLEDEIQKRNRFRASDGEENLASLEHKQAFNRFLRRGEEFGLKDLEKKAITLQSDGAGGYLVPEELDRAILDLLKPASPMRRLCTVISVSNNEYKKLVNTHGASSGWVGEVDARSETNSPTFEQLTPYMGEIYANPAVSQTALDDAAFNVEGIISNEIALEFAYQEGVAFITGNGTAKPKGIAGYTFASTDDGTRAFGQIQYVATGVSGDFAASGKFDVFHDLIAKFKEGMLESGAAWIAKGTTITAIRKIKDGQGAYLWNPSLAEGQKPSLFGYPVVQVDAMPAIAGNSYSIALANWPRAYQIVDRIGSRMLRDPFTNKPYVHFYTTKRVGGFVVDSEAIKFIKFGAS